jgi:hypothetical protein
MAPALSRRRFLAAAGLTLGSAALGGLAGCTLPFTATAARPTRASFVSRPDLNPPLITTAVDGPLVPGLIFITGDGPLITDNQGNPIWYQPVSSSVADFKMQVYQGQPVLTWWQGSVISPGFGQGIHIVTNASYQQIRTIQAANGYQADLHDLQLTPQGTALLTAYTTVAADLSKIGGSSSGTLLTCILQEIDLDSGQLLFEWRSVDHVDPSESYVSAPKNATQAFDYFHINSVAVGPDGNLLISARNTWTLYKLDRRSGAVIWRLGGKRSDFSLGERVQFAFQHDARWHGDTDITLFDDGAGPPNVQPQSRGLRLTVDETARTARLRDQFLHVPGTLATSQGNVQRLENGNVFIGWGSQPYFTEHDVSGRQVFKAKMEAGQSYRAFRWPWIGKPTNPPTIVVRRSDSGAVTVYASWNGATEVSSWQVLAGSNSAQMVPVVTAPRTGFETTIKVPGPVALAAARALDKRGQVLATSAIAKT